MDGGPAVATRNLRAAARRTCAYCTISTATVTLAVTLSCPGWIGVLVAPGAAVTTTGTATPASWIVRNDPVFRPALEAMASALAFALPVAARNACERAS